MQLENRLEKQIQPHDQVVREKGVKRSIFLTSGYNSSCWLLRFDSAISARRYANRYRFYTIKGTALLPKREVLLAGPGKEKECP